MSNNCLCLLCIVSLLFLSCQPRKKSELNLEALSFVLAQPSPLSASCQRFLLTEGACVATQDNVLVTCNNLISAIRSRITPTNLASDSVIELYFNCFSQANLVYNGLISCNRTSFQTNADYRRNQRLTSGSQLNANSQWRAQFNNCARIENGIPPADSGLREIQVQLTGDPFQ